MATTSRRFSTGLPFLDRQIDGGLPPGSLLSLTAPPTSQSELLLAELMRTRPTVVISTTRPEDELREWAEAHAGSGEVEIVSTNPESLLDEPGIATNGLTPESFLIIDSVNGLETAPRDQYLYFLNQLKARLRESESVGILHCIDQLENPPRRSLTLHRSDFVWQLEVLVLSREINTRLLVTKARQGRALTEPVPLRLTDRVQIDTSRRIA